MSNTILHLDDKEITLDKEGYLKKLADWQPQVAEYLAQSENIQLTEAHWEIIHALRQFYHTYQLSPAMRVLVKYISRELGVEKGHSIYLMQLFPGNPAKLASKISGLPKPNNCI